ncbi:NPCBM/NEW2 domain-containing protein [Deinococcus sp. QL22]|uniref:NPCBM/NEW2 domain-containing protein n=1 Tax=Deinococcus sp. QL22 TaxID=2939437 RepID=UPI002016B6D3|nr:NPCBM/NEW2 domain-containing protein [Deinococcus sp. QL22]UQN08717.1 NPCBM/NEW2 domain-containing protein [Deinococcus sp. QL22]
MHPRLTRSLLVGSALILWLTACGQSPSSGTANPYAGGASYPWSYTASPHQLTPLSLTAGENNLYYEPILAAHNSWGPIEIDRSNGEQQAGDGKTLTLNEVTYARGYGTHAGSELRFSLKGTDATCTRFTSQIGLDDEVGSKGSVVFQVYLDGQQAYDSGTMTGASVTKTVSLDITGKQELRLVVTDAGDGIDYDHADWAKPLIFCVATTPPNPTPGNGSLDVSFQRLPDYPYGFDGALAPDGKILIRGSDRTTRQNPDGTLSFGSDEVTRYTSDGTVDATFGQGGRIVLEPRYETFSDQKLLVQPDGKVLINVRPASQNSQVSFVEIKRYRADGSLDPGYGQQGTVATNFFVRTMALQADGKLIIAGSELGGGWLVQRLNTNGTLDTGFGVNGRVTSVFPDTSGRLSYGATPWESVVQANGKILVVGDAAFEQVSGGRNTFSQRELALARYNPDGTPDVTFSGDGLLRDAFIRSSENYLNHPYAVAIQANGNILVGGLALVESSVEQERFFGGALVRYTPGGTRDSAFASGGVALFLNDGPAPCRTIEAVALQQDGKILVTGPYSSGTPNNSYQACAKRLQPTGAQDTSFDPTAAQTSSGQATLVQPDGRVLFGLHNMVRVWP